MATTVNVLNALRYAYGANKVQYLFNQESPTYNMLGKVKKTMGGRGQFIIPIFKQNPGAFKGITEGGALPTALQPATTEALFALQEYVGLYDISWKLIQDSATDKFAFQQALQLMDDGVRRRVLRNLNSDLLDDGRGRLGVAAAANDSTTLTFNSLPRIEVGMVADYMAGSDDDTIRANGSAFTVTGVDPIARTVVKNGSALTGTAATDYIVIAATTDISVTTTALHSHGILGVVSDANPTTTAIVPNYGLINRSTAGNEFWKAVKLANGGTARALTEDLLLQALDGAREKGHGMIKAWFSNLKIVRRYHELLRQDTIFTFGDIGPLGGGLGRKNANVGAGKNSEDGKSVYEFSGVPWYIDPYYNANVVVGLDTDHFWIGTGDSDVPRPISEVFDGVPTFRQTANATFEVAWYYQMQLLSDNPASGVQVADVAES